MAKNSAEIENLDQKKCMVQGRNSSVGLVLHLAQLRHCALRSGKIRGKFQPSRTAS